MPLHKGPLTLADAVSLATCALFVVQPGVDRRAAYQWLLDNVFGGSLFNLRIWGVQFCLKLVEWGCIAFYTALYALEIPVVERYRSYSGAAPWPWKSANAEVRAEYRALQWKAFRYIVKFHAVVLALEMARWLWLEDSTLPAGHAVYDTIRPDAIPHWTTSAWQVAAGVAIAETGFYWGHRLLHAYPWMYRHHKQHHEYVDTGVLSTFYVSFVDALITDLIPVGVAVVGLRMHLYTIWMLMVPLVLNAVWVHCGYEHPLRFNPLSVLPLCTESERTHDLHHRNGRYNFGGAYFLWDRLAGTWRDPALGCGRLLKPNQTQAELAAAYAADGLNKPPANGTGEATNGHAKAQ